eukprot:3625511-Karenia_brevis.AAC.1
MPSGPQNPQWQISYLCAGKHYVLAKGELAQVSPECITQYILVSVATSVNIDEHGAWEFEGLQEAVQARWKQ